MTLQIKIVDITFTGTYYYVKYKLINTDHSCFFGLIKGKTLKTDTFRIDPAIVEKEEEIESKIDHIFKKAIKNEYPIDNFIGRVYTLHEDEPSKADPIS